MDFHHHTGAQPSQIGWGSTVLPNPTFRKTICKMVFLAGKSIVNVVAYCSAHYEKGIKLNFRHIQQTLVKSKL
jgi:hypothetical protein